VLAVECDGATYHGALSARERDRHRQAVLEGMGWKFHRIWSTDWFHRRPKSKSVLPRLSPLRGLGKPRFGAPMTLIVARMESNLVFNSLHPEFAGVAVGLEHRFGGIRTLIVYVRTVGHAGTNRSSS